MVTSRRRALLVSALLVLLAACASADDGEEAIDASLTAPFDEARLVIDGDETVELTAFIADTPSLRRQGLQGWPRLPDRTGMLFVYDQDTQGGFWMKDTAIALSIAFADADGRIHTILDMQPCAEDPCPSYSPEAPYRYALEVPEGFFDELDIGAGSMLRISDDMTGSRDRPRAKRGRSPALEELTRT